MVADQGDAPLEPTCLVDGARIEGDRPQITSLVEMLSTKIPTSCDEPQPAARPASRLSCHRVEQRGADPAALNVSVRPDGLASWEELEKPRCLDQFPRDSMTSSQTKQLSPEARAVF